MALIERLMGLEQPKIGVHAFHATCVARIRGTLTAAQVKSGFGMDVAASAEYDILAAQAPTGGTTNAQLGQLNYANKIMEALILAEEGFPGYQTAAEVRTKLGL